MMKRKPRKLTMREFKTHRLARKKARLRKWRELKRLTQPGVPRAQRKRIQLIESQNEAAQASTP